MKQSVFRSHNLRLPRIFTHVPFICGRCQSQLALASHSTASHRTYSTSTSITPTISVSVPSLSPTLPPRAGFAHLTSRRLVSLRGPDAAHFLQGVITANVSWSSAHRSSGFYAAFLNAQGRVINDVFVYLEPDTSGQGWLVEVDAVEAEKLYQHIKKYKLRAKFDVRLIEESEMGIWSIWRDKDGTGKWDGSSPWTAHTIREPGIVTSHEIGCIDTRAPGMGRRLILPISEKPHIDADMEEASEDSYRVRRYLRGVAEGQDEILREVALPQESNIDFMGGIDYRKGCYVGQELTIRTHHTGVVRKRILPLVLYDMEDEPPRTIEYKPGAHIDRPPAETVIARFNKKGRSAGKWLAGTCNIGLGLCRVELMTDTVVQGEAGSFKDGDEFKLEWNSGDGDTKLVKVKAFVPPWHLTK